MSSSGILKAGAARTDITPGIGTYLAGSLRRRESRGVRDELFARALVLSSAKVKIALVTLDLIGIEKDTADKARLLIEEGAGIAKENIMISATHTHCGPYSIHIFDANKEKTINEKWLKDLPYKIAETVCRANNKLQEAEIGAGTGKVGNISHHRRLILRNGKVLNSWTNPPREDVTGPAGPIDPELGVVGVKTQGKDLIAAVINYACHVNSGFGNFFSADYPGVVANLIRKSSGEGAISLYTAGACGNINTVGTTEEIGNSIGKEAEKVLKSIKYSPDVPLRALRREIHLPLRDFKLRLDEIIRCRGEEAVDTYTREINELEKIKDKYVITELQVLVIGNTALVGIPGEYFVEFGLEIKERSPFARTFIVELANDYAGYIPTEEAFRQGGYEVLDAKSSKLAPEAGRIIVDNITEMLRGGKDRDAI